MLLESNEESSQALYEYQEYALGVAGLPSPYPASFDRNRRCAPDDASCGNSCSAVAKAVNEIANCLDTAFGSRPGDPGLGPWVQPVPPDVAMNNGCFSGGPSQEKQCAAVRCADGSAAGICSFGVGCCCNAMHVDPGVLPDGPLPGCPDGIDPYKMCVPEI
jgi:hypothetical protein